MGNIFFNKNLEFEVYVIGYSSKGESIVFFLRTDGVVVYTGIVDCYEVQHRNLAVELLEKEGVHVVNFVCWTHPHEDHTIGLDSILDGYCNENTKFWLPLFAARDFMESYSSAPLSVYSKIYDILKSRKINKVQVKDASDNKLLERFHCSGKGAIADYIFEIQSFAPDTSLVGRLLMDNSEKNDNLYSVGLIINVGYFYIVLGGDVENRTIIRLPETYFENIERIDYLKIPHHTSKSSETLIDKFIDMNIGAPSVATTTIYRIHNIPDINVLKKYIKWESSTKVYSTGNIIDGQVETYNYGIIKTTIDILGDKVSPIETTLCGNAICVNEELAVNGF